MEQAGKQALIEAEKDVGETIVKKSGKATLQEYLIKAGKVTGMTALALGAGQLISCFVSGDK